MELLFLLPVTEIVIVVYSFGIGLFLNNIIILCIYLFKKNKANIEEKDNGILV